MVTWDMSTWQQRWIDSFFGYDLITDEGEVFKWQKMYNIGDSLPINALQLLRCSHVGSQLLGNTERTITGIKRQQTFPLSHLSHSPMQAYITISPQPQFSQ